MTDSNLGVAIGHNNNNNIINNLDRYRYLGDRHHLPLKASRKESVSLYKREDPRISPDSSQSPESPFRCSFCCTSFQEEPFLTEHLLEQHKVLSPTRCPICQKYIRDLPQHIARQHPQRLLAAEIAAEMAGDRGQQQAGLVITPVDLAAKYRAGSRSPPDMARSALPPMRLQSVSPPSSVLLRTTSEMLRAASNNSNSCSPVSNIHHHHHSSSAAAESASLLPMNLSIRNCGSGFNAGQTVAKLLHGNGGGGMMYEGCALTTTTTSDNESTSGSEASMARKRRKQTHVPESNKDERYWARRLKNNEAAKRSRDMRIKREKVVFEENSRLERIGLDLKGEVDRLTTDNKELHLKMDLILEENARLKSLLLSYQSREEATRKDSGASFMQQQQGLRMRHFGNGESAVLLKRRGSVGAEGDGEGDHEEVEMKPFPFPVGR